MWYEDLKPNYPWSSLWYGYIMCGCGAIRPLEGACPVCAAILVNRPPEIMRLDDGREITVNQNIYMGAEGRIEDYMYLNMLEREYRRPLTDAGPERAGTLNGASERTAIVVLYWSYFETRFERLLRAGMRNLPPRVTEDLLGRYANIGARMDRLYRVLFDTTFRTDLAALGLERVGQHLDRVQERRNAFAHGEPAAIDDALITSVVENLKAEHEAWIAAFNHRMVRNAAT